MPDPENPENPEFRQEDPENPENPEKAYFFQDKTLKKTIYIVEICFISYFLVMESYYDLILVSIIFYWLEFHLIFSELFPNVWE